jgi:RimJ/RimL family protein N-acetyltransferase
MELFTPRLLLRDFQQNDLACVKELESLSETYYFESSQPNIEQITKKLQQTQAEALHSPRTSFHLAITIRPLDQVRGRVSLTLINESIREWEIGWAIHPDEWGKGFATEAAHRVLEFTFSELQAHRVVAFSHAENTASIRVMKKLNMQQEGLLRETIAWKNGWSDEVVYSILDREWKDS